MKYLVCLLEEPSASEMLTGILKRLVSEEIHIQMMVFEGKQDLEKQLERKLKHWNLPNSLFLVLRDQDSGDCYQIKQALLKKVQASGKEGKTLIRIACHELESFYLGDLAAVEKGLSLPNLARYQTQQKYRDPDTLANAAEELCKLTKNHYQKVSGSRSIAPYLDLEAHNRSVSFNTLLTGIKKLMGGN
ncbi:MAG: DUF4276 family protein [SAR324 cluster bacterium]|nr:DUF4276 family protein [SAR324 cluster bacterium]